MKKERKEVLQKKNTSVGLLDIFKDEKYQPLTAFAAISSFVNQMSGITAINIYQATILQEIPGLNITVGIYMLSIGNVVGAVAGPLI